MSASAARAGAAAMAAATRIRDRMAAERRGMEMAPRTGAVTLEQPACPRNLIHRPSDLSGLLFSRLLAHSQREARGEDQDGAEHAGKHHGRELFHAGQA